MKRWAPLLLLLMEAKRTTSRIFWPVPCPGSDQSGFLIGWNVQGFTACVAGVLPFEFAELPALDHAIGEEGAPPA